MSALPPRLAGPLVRFAAGQLPVNVALMHVLIEARAPEDARHLIAAARAAWPEASARFDRLAAEAVARPQAWALVRRIIDGVPHEEHPADCASLFDRAAAISADAASALYALGDPDLLEAATQETAAWVRTLLPHDGSARLLDLGCGSGRFAAALAGDVGLYIGADVSGAMLAKARRRVAHLPHAAFTRIAGGDLAPFVDNAFDLVLAADVFPYMPDRAAMLAEIARVLWPGGACALLNFTYTHDAEALLRNLAMNVGLNLFRRPAIFRYWDAAAFVLGR